VLSALVIGVFVLGVLFYVVVIRSAHDGPSRKHTIHQDV